MNIMFFTPIHKISFGSNAERTKAVPFQKEYDEIVLKAAKKEQQRNHRVCLPSYLNFQKKIDTFVNAFQDTGLTPKSYLKAILKMPMIIACDPNTLISNVEGTLSCFKDEHLSRKDYIKACLKQPVLVLQKPETIENNIRNLVKIYSESGLTVPVYLKMALVHPSLFSQSPEGVSKRINTTINRYKESGLTTEAYIKALKRYPSVASLSPDNIERNITEIVNKYSKYGIDEKQYIKMLKFSPMGFCINAQNKIESINKLIDSLKDYGMTEEKCIKTFIRQPLVFFNNMETLVDRIKFLTFLESEKLLDQGITTKNKFQNLDNAIMKSLSYSREMNYLLLLRDKLKYNCGESVVYRHIKDTMAEFVRENDFSTFEFKISKSEYTKDFIEFVEKYSKEIAGRNIFKIHLR